MGLLQVRDLGVTFDIRGRGDWPWSPARPLHAVRDVSFDLAEGETLGIVGESGSGKSTLARALVGTVPASRGRIDWQGTNLAALSPAKRRVHRKDVQMVFQDPLAALNPRMTVGEIIAEPLRTHRPEMRDTDVRGEVGAMMERVGLLPNLLNRYPHEFSG
ncbi:MAG: ATP-binding cassette domain-containing protein, partial [Shimia sp.]